MMSAIEAAPDVVEHIEGLTNPSRRRACHG